MSDPSQFDEPFHADGPVSIIGDYKVYFKHRRLGIVSDEEVADVVLHPVFGGRAFLSDKYTGFLCCVLGDRICTLFQGLTEHDFSSDGLLAKFTSIEQEHSVVLVVHADTESEILRWIAENSIGKWCVYYRLTDDPDLWRQLTDADLSYSDNAIRYFSFEKSVDAVAFAFRWKHK